MVRVKKARKEIKVLKEIDSRTFREVKRDKNGNVEDDAEEENSREFSDSTDFSPTGNRTAPTITADNSSQNLERVAETAPTPRTTAETPASNVSYSADYSTRYDNVKYDTVREQEVVVRPGVRSAGSLSDTRDFSLRNMRSMRSAWQDSQQQGQAASSWDTNLPDERRYQPKEDSLKEQTKQIEKRRRMG